MACAGGFEAGVDTAHYKREIGGEAVDEVVGDAVRCWLGGFGRTL